MLRRFHAASGAVCWARPFPRDARRLRGCADGRARCLVVGTERRCCKIGPVGFLAGSAAGDVGAETFDGAVDPVAAIRRSFQCSSHECGASPFVQPDDPGPFSRGACGRMWADCSPGGGVPRSQLKLTMTATLQRSRSLVGILKPSVSGR